MTVKKIVQDFYKSDVLLDSEKVQNFLHPDIVLEWHSSKGYHKLKYDQIIDLSKEFSKSYIRSKSRISHILVKGNMVSVRYAHYVKTIENPREEMLLAHFMVIWELKDNKLFHGFQMSQL
jgi:predicted SnoaL-like aldol condensation-catalyzing enzyme